MAISKSEYLSGLGKFKTKQDAYNESIFAKKGDIVGGIAYKGSVANFAALPADNNSVGDMYNIQSAGGVDAHGTPIKADDNVIWNGTGWDNLGGEVDLSGKVDKVAGKDLSTNDYTDAEKEKLTAIEAGAQVNIIESITVDNVAQAVTDKGVNIDLSGKVDKVQGKQLSTEDYTTAEKTKLAGVETGAQVNVVETIKVDGTSLTVTDKAVNIDLSGKVDVINGKGLSTNDFTDAYKTKLDGITEETITQADIDALFDTGDGD